MREVAPLATSTYSHAVIIGGVIVGPIALLALIVFFCWPDHSSNAPGGKTWGPDDESDIRRDSEGV